MNIETLVAHLENKTIALKEKMRASKEKGMFDLHEVFNNEWAETQVSIRLLNKAREDIHFYTNKEVREKMIAYVIQEVPDLALYFKSESINKVLSDTVGKAFDKLADEHFTNRVVNLVGE